MIWSCLLHVSRRFRWKLVVKMSCVHGSSSKWLLIGNSQYAGWKFVVIVIVTVKGNCQSCCIKVYSFLFLQKKNILSSLNGTICNVCMYRGCPSWNCPWNWAVQLGLGEGPINKVDPMSQPHSTIDTMLRMLAHTCTLYSGQLRGPVTSGRRSRVTPGPSTQFASTIRRKLWDCFNY